MTAIRHQQNFKTTLSSSKNIHVTYAEQNSEKIAKVNKIDQGLEIYIEPLGAKIFFYTSFVIHKSAIGQFQKKLLLNVITTL